MVLAQSKLRSQKGGTILGFILGLLVGLLISLGVAIYVTKVPIPFLNKSVSRTAEQDAAEEKKNKDWDPNAPLYNKTSTKPSVAANSASVASSKSDEKQEPVSEKPPSSTADLIGDLIRSKTDTSAANSNGNTAIASAPSGTNTPATDPFYYYVQVGAFRSNEEAESQRAKLSLQGYDPHISDKEQAGKTVFRVRLGPLMSKDEAEKVQVKLTTQKVEAAIIRVQR